MKGKKLVSALIVGGLTLLVLFYVTNFLVAVLGGFLGAVIGFFATAMLFKEEIIQEVEKEIYQQPIDVSQDAIEALISFEEVLVFHDKKLEKDIAVKVETLVEDLLMLVPIMNEKFYAQTLSFEVTNLAKEVLSQRIMAFLNLDEKDKELKKESLMQDLEGMQKLLEQVKDILRNEALSQNERESLLTQIKYTNL